MEFLALLEDLPHLTDGQSSRGLPRIFKDILPNSYLVGLP